VKLSSLKSVFQVLNDAGVRYVVVGGVAVNAHGYQRLTQDLDLAIQLQRENILAAFEALSLEGYQTTVPITAEQFVVAENRQQWKTQKHMQVLCMHSAAHPETMVDIFIDEPFDFDQEYISALVGEIAQGVTVRFASIPTLIKMKEIANRDRDRDDIQHLRWILAESSHE